MPVKFKTNFNIFSSIALRSCCPRSSSANVGASLFATGVSQVGRQTVYVAVSPSLSLSLSDRSLDLKIVSSIMWFRVDPKQAAQKNFLQRAARCAGEEQQAAGGGFDLCQKSGTNKLSHIRGALAREECVFSLMQNCKWNKKEFWFLFSSSLWLYTVQFSIVKVCTSVCVCVWVCVWVRAIFVKIA